MVLTPHSRLRCKMSRVRNVIAINIMRFVWDPRETVAEALLSAHRTIGGSVAMLFSKRSLRRLLSGNLRVKAPVIFFSKRLVRTVSLIVSHIRAGPARSFTARVTAVSRSRKSRRSSGDVIFGRRSRAGRIPHVYGKKGRAATPLSGRLRFR